MIKNSRREDSRQEFESQNQVVRTNDEREAIDDAKVGQRHESPNPVSNQSPAGTGESPDRPKQGVNQGISERNLTVPNSQGFTAKRPTPSGVTAEVPAATRSSLISPPLKTREVTRADLPDWFSAHAQSTVVTQENSQFRSPYAGRNSFRSQLDSATSETTTAFLATRVWDGGDLIFNPEIAGGTGLSGVTGIGGFPNGEITRVGKPSPTPYVARLLMRQTWGLGGDQEDVEEGPNQVAGKRDVHRLTMFIGRLAFTDIMDNNRHSHDPRTQLMNWSMMYNGAWDYPADVRGYSYGMAFDYNRKDWAIRYGIFGEPEEANGTNIDSHVLKANGQAIEFEQRIVMFERPGAVRLMAYWNRANMGSYRQSLAEMPIDPDITATRSYRSKYGVGANFEQDLTEDLGVWGRAGWNDGQTESWAFTEIDQTVALGFLLTGDKWRRPQDEVGLGLSMNGLSAAHRDYIGAGGVGFILGDGRLSYAHEQIIETYYNWKITNGITFTGDIQGVRNPGYNSDRGPLALFAMRLHFEY